RDADRPPGVSEAAPRSLLRLRQDDAPSLSTPRSDVEDVVAGTDVHGKLNLHGLRTALCAAARLVRACIERREPLEHLAVFELQGAVELDVCGRDRYPNRGGRPASQDHDGFEHPR